MKLLPAMQRLAAASVYLACGLLFLSHYWGRWATLCNEACPTRRLALVYAALAIVALSTLLLAGLTAGGRLRLRTSGLAFVVLAAAAMLGFATLTDQLRSGVAAQDRVGPGPRISDAARAATVFMAGAGPAWPERS